MACSKPQITGAGDCGHLCLCVCKCRDGGDWKPKCPNLHVFRLNIHTTETTTDPDAENPADSMDSVLLSMHEVTNDYFIWKRPRIPDDTDVGNVTIKTEKVLSELEGGCTNDLTQGPTGALEVRYISVTTDTDKLVYQWDGTQLCKTSGTGRITSITSRWTVTPAGGADLCCMPRKVVRRIWLGTETLNLKLSGMTDGSYDTGCAGDAVKAGSCDCYNNWIHSTDSSSFSEYVDGYYLAAHFEVSAIMDTSSGDGPCGEVNGTIDPVCIRSCDAISNLTVGPATLDFSFDDDCRSRQLRMLWNRKCEECKCQPVVTPNKIETPVNYTHLLDCCEGGGAPHPMCPPGPGGEGGGEGWTDTCCPTIFAYAGCKCFDIPTTLSTCDIAFPFPTCPLQYSEWQTAPRTIAGPCTTCACLGGSLQAEG